MFVGWIAEGEEHKAAFENSTEMTGVFLSQLKRRSWNVTRKVRVIRLIRKLVEEGIIVRGVKELYEEGCRILSNMEMEEEGGSEEEEEEEGQEQYMSELYLLRLRGEQKKLRESDVSVLRREVEEEKRRREEIEEEMKAKKEKDEEWIRNGGTGMHLMQSLDGIGVEFGDVSKMRKDNNSIIHNNEQIWVSGFVGRKLDNSIHRMFEFFLVISLFIYLLIIGHSNLNVIRLIAVYLFILLLWLMDELFLFHIYIDLSQSFQLQMHPKDFHATIGYSRLCTMVCIFVFIIFYAMI